MSNEELDFYEILEISQNASAETIERMFRFLAQRYHPDRDTGDAERFEQVVIAHKTLSDPEKRAGYDIWHKKNSQDLWSLAEKAGDSVAFGNDEIIQSRILSIMYVKRKSDTRNPGVGNMQLEQMTGCPREVLEFHIWYMKEKGWIIRMENGLIAITADGVDKTLSAQDTRSQQKRITEQREEVIHL